MGLAKQRLPLLIDGYKVIDDYFLDFAPQPHRYFVNAVWVIALSFEKASHILFFLSQGCQSGQKIAIPEAALNHLAGLHSGSQQHWVSDQFRYAFPGANAYSFDFSQAAIICGELVIDEFLLIAFEIFSDFFEIRFLDLEDTLPLGGQLMVINFIEVVGELSLLALPHFVAQSGLGRLAARKQKHFIISNTNSLYFHKLLITKRKDINGRYKYADHRLL